MPNSVLQILLALSTTLKLSNAFPIGLQTKFDYSPGMEKSKITWEVLKFIATNYLAHAFTVNTPQGYQTLYSILFSLSSLAFPYMGLVTACRSLGQMPVLEPDILKRAARAGALCMVARTKYWKAPIGSSNDSNGNIEAPNNSKVPNNNSEAPNNEIWCWKR